MSFILDALRKSEHERQRAAVPGLSQVPLGAPPPQMPRWALVIIVVLGAAVLALGVAWWQSAREPAPVPAARGVTVERGMELPPPALPSAAPPQTAAVRAPAAAAPSASNAASLAAAAAASTGATEVEQAVLTTPAIELPAQSPALPSAASLAAEGVSVPPLRLELHAYSAQPPDRFVFINGRKYAEGERLAEGPQLVSIEPTGAVLAYSGRRFMLVQE